MPRAQKLRLLVALSGMAGGMVLIVLRPGIPSLGIPLPDHAVGAGLLLAGWAALPSRPVGANYRESSTGEILFRMVATGLQLFFLLMVLDAPFYWRAYPPRSVTNFSEFQEWRPRLAASRQMTATDGGHFQVTGPAGRLLASGPSIYLFDGSESLIGWTPDSGDLRVSPIPNRNQYRDIPIHLDQTDTPARQIPQSNHP